LFYGITTLYWVTAKDFIQLAKYTGNKVNKQTAKENRISLIKMILVKVGYYAVFFGLPIFVFNLPVYQLLLGFLLMHFIAGITLTTVFQLAHSIEETNHPLPDDQGIIEDNWAMHQIRTTANFSKKSKFLTWYLGGLNYQIEHHLFPNICHIHYPNIAPIVKKTAEEYELPYVEHKTFVKALESHIGLMRKIA
jgi:linoleoyl-CoA desaturase